jgi:hypothetical protein
MTPRSRSLSHVLRNFEVAKMTDQYRIIGQLEASVESQGERLDRIETKLDLLTEYIQQQKGGAKVIWAIAAAGGVIGVSLVKLGGMALAALKGTP